LLCLEEDVILDLVVGWKGWMDMESVEYINTSLSREVVCAGMVHFYPFSCFFSFFFSIEYRQKL